MLLLVSALLSGCSLKKSVDVTFAENLPQSAPVLEEINMLDYLIAEPGVSYEMTATYTTEDNQSGEYLAYGSGGLCFKPEKLGKVEVKLIASKEGKKDVELSANFDIKVRTPRVSSSEANTFFIGQTVTIDDLMAYMTIVPKSGLEASFKKVTFNDKEVDLRGKTKFTFKEASEETIFYIDCKNSGGEREITYLAKVTPYKNKAEYKDLSNYIDSSKQQGMATISYDDEESPFGGGSYSYRITASSECVWAPGAQSGDKTWLSYVFVQFPEPFDRTKQYITFDAKRSEDSYDAIVYHYVVDTWQHGTASVNIPANTWTKCSTMNFVPAEFAKDNTLYTGICFTVVHRQANEGYDPENVWNMIDNIKIENYPEKNRYEELDLTNNVLTTLQGGLMEINYCDEVSTLYEDSSKKGTYSYEITASASSVYGTDTYGRNYVHIDLPFDGTKYHPVFDIKRTEDCDANILVYYTIGGMAQGFSSTYTEANAWNTIETSNFRLTPGNTNTNYTGIAIIFNHPQKSVDEYDEENVKIIIDNLRLEENYF